MSGPLRIGRRAAPGAAAPGPAPLGGWLERLVKLFPAEIAAVYLAGRPHAGAVGGAWPIVCLALLVVVRAWGTRDPARGPQWGAVAIAAVSFAIWVLAVDGRILGLAPGADLAALLVLVWVTLLPALYKGDG